MAGYVINDAETIPKSNYGIPIPSSKSTITNWVEFEFEIPSDFIGSQSVQITVFHPDFLQLKVLTVSFIFTAV